MTVTRKRMSEPARSTASRVVDATPIGEEKKAARRTNKLARQVTALALPSKTAKSDKEVLPDELMRRVPDVTGTKCESLGCQLVAQLGEFMSVGSAPQKDPEKQKERLIALAIQAFAEMEPKNYLEGMLVAQMISTKQAAHQFLARAIVKEQPGEFVDANVLRATRLMRVFVEQIDALQRLRGKSGQQRVVVEHVNVQAGGQAIVGAVSATVAGEGVKGDGDRVTP